MKWQMGSSSRNVEDRRGMRMVPGGGFGRMGIGGVVILLILSLVFKRDFLSLAAGGGGGTTTENGPVNSTPAEDSLKEFITWVLNDAQGAWPGILSSQSRAEYREAHLVLFRDAVQSGCGSAQSATGPFY